MWGLKCNLKKPEHQNCKTQNKVKTLIWVWHVKVLKFEQYAKKEKQQQQQQKLCLVCTSHKLAHHEVALWIQRSCKYLLLLVNYKITTFGGQLTSLNILIHISVPSLENYMNMDTQMSLRSSGNTALLGCTCHAGNIEK